MANRLLARHDPPGSLTAFVVASVARAAAAHPEVHAYRRDHRTRRPAAHPRVTAPVPVTLLITWGGLPL
jgi:hypothetical protein